MITPISKPKAIVQTTLTAFFAAIIAGICSQSIHAGEVPNDSRKLMRAIESDLGHRIATHLDLPFVRPDLRRKITGKAVFDWQVQKVFTFKNKTDHFEVLFGFEKENVNLTGRCYAVIDTHLDSKEYQAAIGDCQYTYPNGKFVPAAKMAALFPNKDVTKVGSFIEELDEVPDTNGGAPGVNSTTQTKGQFSPIELPAPEYRCPPSTANSGK